MNNGITAKILEGLSEGAIVSAALFKTISEPSGEGQKSEFQREKRNFHLILSKLKREGFVKTSEDKWSITSAGRVKLLKLLKRMPRHSYEKEVDTSLKIIIFDVPEKEQKKRVWLRRRLGDLGFKMLQKSVWAGKIKLPEEFIQDLKDLKMFQYIDILAVTKTGSIKTIS
ncbi:MAG: CRISPR-associated endonuclease Cas2 [Candidatus Colwellbacteria bacterium]|nr:CRISPR-associated endonuclease Cas2 [Candidatus Colwellbacteria bacterium]